MDQTPSGAGGRDGYRAVEGLSQGAEAAKRCARRDVALPRGFFDPGRSLT